MLKRAVAIAAAFSLSSAFAIADGPRIGPNGGQMRDANGNHLEFVSQGRTISLYVTDGEHRPIDAQQMKGRAIVLDGQQRANVLLAPAGGNRLKGSIDFVPGSDTKAVVVLTLPTGEKVQARFAN